MRADVFVACRDGDLSSIQKLYGQNPRLLREVAFEGNSLLHIAAREGHGEIVSWALTHLSGYRCMTKARNTDKNTALHEAAKGGNGRVISSLLGYNKSAASRRNQFGETALIIASENGHVEAVRLLMEATPWYMILWPRNDHQTCLHVAAYEGHLDVVKIILGKPSLWDILHLISLIPDVCGVTPLHIAIHGRHMDIANEIMNTKLNSWCCSHWFNKSLMTKKDKLGRCPIHVAALNGCMDIVERFIFLIPDCIEIRSTDLKTALHFAVEYNQFDVVQKLLSPFQPTKIVKLVSYDRDISGNTALHLAAKNGVDPQLVEYLISFSGVKVNAINNDGQSALDIAAGAESDNNCNFSRIAMVLKDQDAKHSFILHSKASRKLNESKIQNNSNNENVMSVDTLVASLVATVTFAAAFQVPGGTNKDEDTNMALETLFQVFLFSDCLAFFASITVVMAWIFRERLQEKLTVDRSPLTKISLLCLELSVMSAALAFVSAIILATIPRNLEKHKDKNFKEYQLIFGGEILTASLVPTVAIILLALVWTFEYYFRTTNDSLQKLKTQFQQVIIYIIPPFLLIFIVIFTYGYSQIK
ncbi:ankyrin repeat-containing protein At2g01680 [Cryptomeria japonica]|uniref:ankyrin repeat-containing protein At2g01680 n=1 Tax=Cryptomeria japonica TaxID=3369 RepID=UPI0025ABD327|nr:ankyrin repeat-containing protein At2g01680 [Cryptomeria japonica]